jgi:hypothetical protein
MPPTPPPTPTSPQKPKIKKKLQIFAGSICLLKYGKFRKETPLHHRPATHAPSKEERAIQKGTRRANGYQRKDDRQD